MHGRLEVSYLAFQKNLLILTIFNVKYYLLFLVLDAYGRIPQGFAQGNFIDLGMFDQCLNIAEKVDDIDIKGKYCYNGLIIPFINLNPSTLQVNQIVSVFVVCVYVH